MSRGRVPAAGIILAGGRSSRMGTAKAWLEWDGSTLLRRTVDVLGEAVDTVVVVGASGQELPSLPPGVRVVDDGRPDEGPLRGMLSGLRALGDPAAVAFVCATDMPFLAPRFVTAVLDALPTDADAAVPRLDGRAHPLAGAYRAGVAGRIAALLGSGGRRMGDLLAGIPVAWLEAHELPGGGRCLGNVNSPAELAAARQASRENGTTSPALPPSSSPTQASAVAPASEVTA